jgi:hypothetical protein
MTGLVIVIACLLFLPAILYIVVPLVLLCFLLIRRTVFPQKFRHLAADYELMSPPLKT